MELSEGDKKFKEAVDAKPVTLDDILSKFSLCGCYHVKTIFLISLACMLDSMCSLNYVFAVEKTEYRCQNTINVCDVRQLNSNVVDNFNPECYERVALEGEISCAYYNNTKVVACSQWVYDKPESFVAEIACQEWKRTLVGTAHCVGYLFGLLLTGPISDRLGRKTVFVTAGILGGIMGVTKSFVTSYWLYISFEFFEKVIGDHYSSSFTLMIEIVATDDRPMFTMIALMGSVMGYVLLALVAWYVQYWRNMLRVIYAPAFLFILYIFCLDESPRWLLTKGRKQKAIDVLNKAARMNGMTLDKAMLQNLVCEDQTEANTGYKTLLKSTLKSKVILKSLLVCLVWWICGTFAIYSLAVNSVLLSGNKYTNFMLIYVAELPTVLLYGYTLKYFKRKIPLMLSSFGAAIVFLAHPFLPDGRPWLSLVIFICGKSMVLLFFHIVYVFTSELFPTYTRNSMHALCSSIGRIGSVLAQQTPLLVGYWHGLPSILVTGMTLLAGLLTLLVPDTAHSDLPNTVREAEEIGKHDEGNVKTRL